MDKSSGLRSYLTVLEHSARQFSALPAFRVPLTGEDGSVRSWRDISYATFHADVLRTARFWVAELSQRRGIPVRAVVGLWLAGTTYADMVHSYALSRAGFVLVPFSTRLPAGAVVALMARAGAIALVHNAAESPNCGVLAVAAPSPDAVGECDAQLTPLGDPRAEDTFMIFHTSGSTSALPKPVPCTYAWIDTVVTRVEFFCRRKDPARQDVVTTVSSIMHISQSSMLSGALANGACTILPTRVPIPADELVAMVRGAGLTCLRTIGTFLSTYIAAARSSAELLGALQTLDEACFMGIALSDADVAFARGHGVRLRTRFGSTELGPMLYASEDGLLVPFPGARYEFRAIGDADADADKAARLLELIVLRDSPDIPHAALCDAQGEFRTGDLFHEVEPGRYAYRGRADDWIKTLWAGRVDTRSIEDNVRDTCSDLVEDCTVVGWGRPSPVLFLEARTADEDGLKEIVLQRIAPFHALRYPGERISEARCIVIVGHDTLPRTSTKRNIRRRAVEEQFEGQLDEIFA